MIKQIHCWENPWKVSENHYVILGKPPVGKIDGSWKVLMEGIFCT